MWGSIHRICLLLLWCLPGCWLSAQERDFQQSLEAYRHQQYDSAMWFLDRAVATFRNARQTDSLVLAYVHKADITWDSQGNWPAVQMVDTALRLAQGLPDRHLARVAALNKKGQILVHVSHVAEGKAHLLDAENRIPLGDTLNGTVATLYNNISWMYLVQQHVDDALRYAKRSLGIQIALYGEDARQLMGVYQSLGLIANDAGRFDEAETYSLELYRLARLHLPPYHSHMALVHNQLAIIYESECRYTEALQHLRAMVDVTQQAYASSGNPQFLAMAYNNTGHLYHQLGEHSLAEAYFEKALRLHRINYGDEEAGIVQPLAHLADAKRMLGKYGPADSLFQHAYRIQQAYGQGNIREAADLESQMGDLSYDEGNFNEAVGWYKRALAHYRQAGIAGTTMVAETKATLGKTLVELDRIDDALRLHREVLGEYRRRYPKGNILVAGKLNNICEAYLAEGTVDKAKQYSDSTFMELLKSTRLPDSNWIQALPFSRHVARYVDNRAAILEKQYQRTGSEPVLRAIVRLAADYGDYLEQGIFALRTQSALTELAKSQKRLYQAALDAAWLLAERHGRPVYLANAFEFAEMGKGLLLRLAANNLLVDEHAAEKNDIFSRDRQWRATIGALNTQYLNAGGSDDSLLTVLTNAMEHYRDFQDSVQSVGDHRWNERFNLRPYTVNDIRQRLLRKGETLVEYAVTEEHVYAFVVSSRVFKVFRLPRQPITEKIAVLQGPQQLDAPAFVNAAYPLYQSLVAPWSSLIDGDRLIIVPDAELYQINFDVLLSDDRGTAFSELAYLVKRYEISYLLSASSAIQQSGRRHATERGGLFFAPGFTERMKQAYRARLSEKLGGDPVYERLLRQPFSLQAARNALRFVSGELYVEEDANEERFRQESGKYRILHMGTHAEVNNTSPLQSRLFFAKPQGRDSIDDDGILHAYEVYSMQLQAELAVLSACNTGTGKFQEGEGVVSLAHSFLFAGCSAVVMSLWDIDEKTSGAIMTGFYRNLSRGLGKSDALRKAKLAHLAHVPGELAHPYYWAGLGLIGDNDAIYPVYSRLFWIIGLGLAITVAVGLYFFRRSVRRQRPSC